MHKSEMVAKLIIRNLNRAKVFEENEHNILQLLLFQK